MTGTNENILIFVSILEHEFEKEWTANGGLPYTKNADRTNQAFIPRGFHRYIQSFLQSL